MEKKILNEFKVEAILEKWLHLQKIIKEEITLNEICKNIFNYSHKTTTK